MNHLYEDKNGILHACEGAQLIPTVRARNTYVVWTKCEIDVPANKSFESDEQVSCEKCKAQRKDGV